MIASLLPSISPGTLLAGGVTATAASLWMLLPRGRSGRAERSSRWLGGLLGLAALAAFIALGRRLGSVGEDTIFLVVALVAVVSGAATVVSRSPVYAAIWFAMALAGVSGVLLVLGGQFLGVATIVVYAGAILVMFLFVLMLAQPAGLAPYDRVSNEPLLAAVAGAVLLGILSLSIGRLAADPASCCAVPATKAALLATDPGAGPNGPGTVDLLAADHVARLGGELFGRHLLAVEVAGVLLLVALVGSIAIVSRGAADDEATDSRRATP
ncbi:MAG: NADH-quinone oxidoreductase subunit J [Planctomycetota bacterium]|nr:NADH-quinone oxidoreductase subunit J [Planctomycetota bacterium]